MSYNSDRDQFMIDMAKHGVRPAVSRKFLTYAATIDRLAVAACNGDWPADNGVRETRECDGCGCGWAPESYRGKLCPDCHAEKSVRNYASANLPAGWQIVTQGDPRGYTLKLVPPGVDRDSYGVIGVPVRNR